MTIECKRKHYTIKDCSNYASLKKGKCLETTYTNNTSKMLWECELGHQWIAKWKYMIEENTWCPICATNNRTYPIEICKNYAKITHSGKCLSNNYIPHPLKLEWECKKKHQWKASWSSVYNNHSWCPYCSKNLKTDIKECQQYAKNKGGKLISNLYVNTNTKMIWECKEGHQWEAVWHCIKRNRWCPYCRWKTEEQCKKLLEQKLGFEFKKTRFICNDKRYEWDGYNKEHKIAFEYQGYQHYIFPNKFHKTELQYLKAKQRDLDKLQYAKENNIKLIIIPYTEEKNLEEYIKELNPI